MCNKLTIQADMITLQCYLTFALQGGGVVDARSDVGRKSLPAHSHTRMAVTSSSSLLH